MPNFRSNARPLNSGLEQNALHIWIQNDLSFSKLFEISKLDEKWQVNNPISYVGVIAAAGPLLGFWKFRREIFFTNKFFEI